MAGICNINAHIKNKNGVEVESILYRDIFHETKDHDLTNKLWATASIVKDENMYPGAALDENGEFTIESFKKIFDLSSLISDNQNAMNEAKRLGLLNSNEESVPFKNSNSLISAMVEFNEHQHNYVAKLEYNKKGDKMAVIEPRTNSNLTEVSNIKFKSELNSRLLNLLNKVGFNVEFLRTNNRFGVFDPFNAEKNADTLKTVIKISHNELGEEVFPEEFSHVIFSGLKDSIYAQRLDKVFTDEMTQAVLGDEYQQYIDKYKEDGIDAAENYAKEEAEARVLSSMLKGEVGGLDVIARFWANAMKKVSGLSTQEVDKAIKEATDIIGLIKKEIDNGTIVNKINKEAVLKHKEMFNLEEQVSKLKTIAEKGEEMLNKRLSLLREKVNINDIRSEEVNTIEKIRADLAAKRYSISCYNILEAMSRHIANTLDNIENYIKVGTSDVTNLSQLSSRAATIKDATNLIDSYTPYINVLLDIQHYVDNGEIELDKYSIAQIKDIAQHAIDGLGTLGNRMRELRTDTLLTLIKMYVSPDQIEQIGNIKGAAMSMKLMLDRAGDDINFLDSSIFSLGDSRNELVNFAHQLIKSQIATRDRRVNEIAQMLGEASKQLHAAGETEDSIVERYEDGTPTGNFKSFVDYPKFYKARLEYKKKLIAENEALPKNKQVSYSVIQDKISLWEFKNTEEREITTTDDSGNTYIMKERIPESFYNPETGQHGKYYREFKLNKAQQEYWNKIIEIKARLQQVLPSRAQHIFEMPQIYKDFIATIDSSSPSEMIKNAGKFLKREYSITEDNTEFGERDENGNPVHTTMTDLSGAPLKTVPVYFVRRIKDNKMLNTDVTQGMIAYAAMAINYSEMRKISDLLQILNDRVKSEEYKVNRIRGGEIVRDAFNSIGVKYNNISTVKGEGTNIQRAIEELTDRIVFGITKDELPSVKIGDTGKTINLNSAVKGTKAFTSISNLGLNLFSGINNVVMGETQLAIEAIGSEFFGLKDLSLAQLQYGKLLPEFLGKLNSTSRDDKMSLLVNLFNSSEDFTRDIQDVRYNSKFYQRVIGKSNIYFMLSMGEHKLHTVGMFAMLNHIKASIVNNDGSKGSTKSLFELLHIINDDVRGNHIGLSSPIRLEYEKYKNNILKGFYPREGEDTVVVDETNFSTLVENLTMYINNVNASMHGGYSEEEKGNANKKAWWQLLMQFRQWMPATYNKRFSRGYHDFVLGENREGFYLTFTKFIINTCKDLVRGNIQLSLNDKNLTDWQKANLKKAFSEITLFIVLSVLCSMMKSYEGKDQAWHKKMLAYQLERLRLDTGSMVPSTSIIDNAWQILQSPMAGMEGLHNLFNIFKFQNCAVEIEQGRYKGWSVYERDLLKATPLQSLIKVKDLSTETYMFNIFKQNNNN